jgi:hypothetical protein
MWDVDLLDRSLMSTVDSPQPLLIAFDRGRDQDDRLDGWLIHTLLYLICE